MEDDNIITIILILLLISVGFNMYAFIVKSNCEFKNRQCESRCRLNEIQDNYSDRIDEIQDRNRNSMEEQVEEILIAYKIRLRKQWEEEQNN